MHPQNLLKLVEQIRFFLLSCSLIPVDYSTFCGDFHPTPDELTDFLFNIISREELEVGKVDLEAQPLTGV